MDFITTARDLDEVRSLPRAFVFVFVNCAKTARLSHVAFREFLTAWSAIQPRLGISAYCVDLSEQGGEVWETIRKWLREQAQPVDLLTYSGNGALLWVHSGSIDASVPYVAEVEQTKLVTVTRSVFERPAENQVRRLGHPMWYRFSD